MLNKSIVFVVLFFSSISAVIAADLKIGVVDMQAVVAKIPQDSLMDPQVTKELNERNDSLKALQKEMQDIREKAKRDEMTLTSAQKVELGRSLKAKEVEFNLKSTFLQEDAKLVNKKQQNEVFKIIRKAIDKVSAGEKLDLVLTRDAVAFVSPQVDITPKVIDALTK